MQPTLQPLRQNLILITREGSNPISLPGAVRHICVEQHGHSEEFAGGVHVCSENNFPTAAGLASSAAGYACLGVQLNLQITMVQTSHRV